MREGSEGRRHSRPHSKHSTHISHIWNSLEFFGFSKKFAPSAPFVKCCCKEAFITTFKTFHAYLEFFRVFQGFKFCATPAPMLLEGLCMFEEAYEKNE